jgi:hypothetical protein
VPASPTYAAAQSLSCVNRYARCNVLIRAIRSPGRSWVAHVRAASKPRTSVTVGAGRLPESWATWQPAISRPAHSSCVLCRAMPPNCQYLPSVSTTRVNNLSSTAQQRCGRIHADLNLGIIGAGHCRSRRDRRRAVGAGRPRTRKKVYGPHAIEDVLEVTFEVPWRRYASKASNATLVAESRGTERRARSAARRFHIRRSTTNRTIIEAISRT